MNEENEAETGLTLGTPVLYFNQWTGLNTKIFDNLFHELNVEESRNLKPGEVIYIDVDPLHPQGKVYGWVKVRISTIEVISANELRICYIGGNYSGFKTTKEGIFKDIVKAKSERLIASLVYCFPITKRILRT